MQSDQNTLQQTHWNWLQFDLLAFDDNRKGEYAAAGIRYVSSNPQTAQNLNKKIKEPNWNTAIL